MSRTQNDLGDLKTGNEILSDLSVVEVLAPMGPVAGTFDPEPRTGRTRASTSRVARGLEADDQQALDIT